MVITRGTTLFSHKLQTASLNRQDKRDFFCAGDHRRQTDAPETLLHTLSSRYAAPKPQFRGLSGSTGKRNARPGPVPPAWSVRSNSRRASRSHSVCCSLKISGPKKIKTKAFSGKGACRELGACPVPFSFAPKPSPSAFSPLLPPQSILPSLVSAFQRCDSRRPRPTGALSLKTKQNKIQHNTEKDQCRISP